jgi:hypothetical protein
MSTDLERLQRLRIHFIYWVFILILVIIAIATDRWTSKPDFTQYLTYAATMTSLVLALVAIFYSFIANDGLSKSLGNISTVANEVKESKEQISKFLDQTTSSADAARVNTKAMEAVSLEVGSTLVALNTALNGIKAQTDTLNNTVSALPPRLDLLETKVIDAARTWGEKARSSDHAMPAALRDTDVTKFINYAPLPCDLLAYACVLAQKSGKQLSMGEFCTTIEVTYVAWMSGYLLCMHAIDLITSEFVEGQTRAYHITFVHPRLIESTRSYFVSYVKEHFADDASKSTSWLEKLGKVEALFK